MRAAKVEQSLYSSGSSMYAPAEEDTSSAQSSLHMLAAQQLANNYSLAAFSLPLIMLAAPSQLSCCKPLRSLL